MVVTRLWCPASGVTVEGEFELGWVGKLSPDQLDFVGLLLRARNNLQRLAADLGVSYNTARSRLDEIVGALGGEPSAGGTGRNETGRGGAKAGEAGLRVLEALAAREITYEEALRRLRQ
jgi:hypothetical protein